eukprot:CAMPEP_0202889640 /NCGR_PEP_ID=MMETSP1392-20130828/238_1 /ASSEMBLY_ACC=CAM_ASM_000868 /TAXON_ID=225041 /ORGANISM="Chlamydomonas chlamydogama, Strain SAG 11-48b" /LENGTH=76 /DNA_ID=CAMNT_0049573019 /DNA_START=241 /DNA_END=471 /DNA_ORIENTATION=-
MRAPASSTAHCTEQRHAHAPYSQDWDYPCKAECNKHKTNTLATRGITKNKHNASRNAHRHPTMRFLSICSTVRAQP